MILKKKDDVESENEREEKIKKAKMPRHTGKEMERVVAMKSRKRKMEII